MTTAAFTPVTPKLVNGVGPYQIGHEYNEGSIRCWTVQAGAQVFLDEAEFSISPVSSETSGDMYLTAQAASDYDGEYIYIVRDTLAEQDWIGQGGNRETSLEKQMDRITRGMQELQDGIKRTLKIPTGQNEMPPIIGDPDDRADRAFGFDEAGNPVVGPTFDQIEVAENFASAAAASANSALRRFDVVADVIAATNISVGDYAYVSAGKNGEEETFKIFPAGTYTADANLVVDLTGISGQAVSTRTVYADWAEMDADVRALPAGTALRVLPDFNFTTVSADQIMTLSGGLKVVIADSNVFFEHFGAIGDYDGVTAGTDDTAAIHAAFAADASLLLGVPGKKYLFDPVGTVNPTIKAVGTPAGWCEFHMNCGLNDIGLYVSPRQHFTIDGIHLFSTGTSTDGNNTTLLRIKSCAVVKVGARMCSYQFSGSGIEIQQCLHVKVEQVNIFGGGEAVGINLTKDPSNGVGNTTVVIDFPYILGCKNAIRSDGTVALTLLTPITEACGRNDADEGAIHLIGSSGTCCGFYGESNERDFYASDCIFQRQGFEYSIGASAPDILLYVGVDFGSRGESRLTNNRLSIANIEPDTAAGIDLTMGNMTLPVAGGGVRWDGMEAGSFSGTLAASATWETVYTVEDQSGSGGSRKAYRYAVSAGTADQTTGFDAGTILNGVIYSETGTTPAWLRMSGDDIQMSISGSSYALSYKGTVLIQGGL